MLLLLLFITSDKGGGICFCLRSFVCVSVCLWAKLLKNACIDLDEVLHVDRCWDMDELINFWARSGLYFWCRNLLCRENPTYRYCWYTYSWLLRCVVLKWFYSPRAVGTTLSEVNALHLLVIIIIIIITKANNTERLKFVSSGDERAKVPWMTTAL